MAVGMGLDGATRGKLNAGSANVTLATRGLAFRQAVINILFGLSHDNLSLFCRCTGRSAQCGGWRRQLHCLPSIALCGGGTHRGKCHQYGCALGWRHGEHGCLPEAPGFVATCDGAAHPHEYHWRNWRCLSAVAHTGTNILKGTALAHARSNSPFYVRGKVSSLERRP